jgi:hypothetical protein
MDAARKIDPSYCHALCLPILFAFLRIHYRKPIPSVHYPFHPSDGFISSIHYSLLPTGKWCAEVVFAIQPN